MRSYPLLIGSYSKTIGFLQWSAGQPQKLHKMPSNPMPSWLHYQRHAGLLFATEEDLNGAAGKLHAYSLSAPAKHSSTENQPEPQLEHLSSQDSFGSYPCHIMEAEGRLYISNYGSGPIASYSYSSKGVLRPLSQLRHSFDGNPADRPAANPQRQDCSHPHSCLHIPELQGFFSADLGLDQVVFHPLAQAQQTKLGQVPEGYGPRHMLLSPDRSVLYVICELQPILLSYHILPNGELNLLNECHITQSDVTSYCSELCLHPSLPYIYVANRSAGYISQLHCGSKGAVQLKAEYPLASPNPRHIAISPDGAYLFAALQDSHQVQVFAIEGREGQLRALAENEGGRIPTEAPSCIVFV